MLRIVSQNPYRVLGVLSNSPLKERVGNQNRLAAFAKVGKEVTFPNDFDSVITEKPFRSTDSVAAANVALNLDKDQLKHALVWFINGSPIDDVAIKHIQAGNLNKARELFEKKETFSSLINVGVLYLISGNYTSGFSNISMVIHNNEHRSALLKALGIENLTMTEDEIAAMFIEEILTEIPANSILSAAVNIYDKDKIIRFALRTPLADIQTLLDSHSIENFSISESISICEELFNKASHIIGDIKNLTCDIPQVQLLIDRLGKILNNDINTIFGRIKDSISQYSERELKEQISLFIQLLNKVEYLGLSPLIKSKIKESVDALKKLFNEASDIVNYSIATNDDICWCCGAKATKKHECKYTRTEVDYFRNVRTTYTRGVTVHICKDCKDELKAQERESDIGPMWYIPSVIIECIVITLWALSDNAEWYMGPLIVLGAHIMGIGAVVTMALSFGLSWIYSKARSKRKFLRSIDEHPAVILIKKDGYR